MNSPKISWQVLEAIGVNDHDEEYVQYKSYTEEGSYIPGDYVQKKFRVWNNYAGKDDVQNAANCTLVIAFKNFEDNFLLNLLQITVDGVVFNNLEIDIDRAVLDIGDLSGIANTGTAAHKSNYKNIEINIGPIPNNIKSELKGLYFYLEYTNE
jgi:hypothetical protein